MNIKKLPESIPGVSIIQIDKYNPCYYLTYKGESILIGASPEVLKEMSRRGLSIPEKIFIPLAEANLYGDNLHLEFPFYFISYIDSRHRKLEIIGKKEELEDYVIPRLREAIGQNFARRSSNTELEKFNVRDLIKFTEINDEYDFNGLKITQNKKSVTIEETVFQKITLDVSHHPDIKSLFNKKPDFNIKNRPFSFTVIGSGTGFTSDKNSCSKIVHFGKTNIWIDPTARPEETLEKLPASEKIRIEEITDIIITHVHEDHDAGFVPMVLYSHQVLGKKLRLLTTKNIYDALLRKFSNLIKRSLGLNLKEIFDLKEIHPDSDWIKTHEGGAEISCRFNWHCIETLGLKFRYKDKMLAFSGDHLMNEETLRIAEKLAIEKEELGETPLLASKYFKFMKYAWLDADVIVHEQSDSPIHTDENAIKALCESMLSNDKHHDQLRVYLEHNDKKDISDYALLSKYMKERQSADSKKRIIIQLKLLNEGETIFV